MSTLDLIPLLWGAVTVFVVAACQVASLADLRTTDADGERPERPLRG
jgi:hypothetical protein